MYTLDIDTLLPVGVSIDFDSMAAFYHVAIQNIYVVLLISSDSVDRTIY